jgi:FAD/FMN-containing dehydrogenase/Fe-S oxidoreductase
MSKTSTERSTIEALQCDLEDSLEGEVKFDKIFRAIHSTDASVYQILPVGVAIPRNREDVIRIVNLCREHGVSITARGGGTSQAGQAIGAGLQVDFSKHLNRVLDLDIDNRTVTVEPGIVLDALNSQLKPHGLQLPLDLSTADRATIGGMVSNNSSGTRSVVYGTTIDYVEALTVVLSDGTQVELGSTSTDELGTISSQDNLEGACYRKVVEVAEQHRDEISSTFSRIHRRVGGYNLDSFVREGEPFNLARLIVGSEGTLGMMVAAKLRLVPLPKARTLGAFHFSDLLEAMTATPIILKHSPSAVELVDRFLLNQTRGRSEFEPLREFIEGDPGAVLIVEFSGDDGEDLPARLDRLEEELNQRGLGYHLYRAKNAQAQAKIWKLRKAALGLAMSQRGDAKSISFVEDTAVPPDQLHGYIERFKSILAENETEAGFYAHASVGLLHIRPVVNMKTAAGIERFKKIGEAVSDLVLEFGGTISAEHGDGMVRSPFQEKMYGPLIYSLFCEIKDTFDPHGLFNPGKIVRAAEITDNLKYGLQYDTRPVETKFDFSDFGGLSRAVEQCGGVGDCRKTLTGTMCPSYMATRSEVDSTRARANALRLAISGQLGDGGFTDPALYPVLDLCIECKACKTECPTGVDMARVKSEFFHQYQRKHGTPARSSLISRTDRLAAWGSRLAPLSNAIARNRATRALMEKIFKLDRRRLPPSYSRKTFLNWWQSTGVGLQGSHHTQGTLEKIAIFSDTFTNYHEPDHAIAAVKLARHLGAEVSVPQRVCCGRPAISKGMLDLAARQAEDTARTLFPIADAGLPIVFCEPGCYSAVKDDHPLLLSGEAKSMAETVAEHAVTFEEWAASRVDKVLAENGTPRDPLFQNGPNRTMLHGHCHQKALTGNAATVKLLSLIPGCEVVDLDSGCCGMAGSFGYEQEHYDISKAIGERRLLPAIRNRNETDVVVAPGFSCRHQVEHFTGVVPYSTASLLASLIPG